MNKVIPWFRKKLNKLNLFDAPVKEGTVCPKESSLAESLNNIDSAFEVESEDDVFHLEVLEVSKQPCSTTLNKSARVQNQEENAHLLSTPKTKNPCHKERNLSGGDTNFPFVEKDNQVFSSCHKIQTQEDKKFYSEEKTFIKSVPIEPRVGKVHKHFNSLPNLSTILGTDCKQHLFKAPNVKLDEIGRTCQAKLQIPDKKPNDGTCTEEVSVERSPLSPTYEEDFIPEGVFCHYWIGEVLKPLQTSYTFASCFDSGSYGSVCKLKHRITKAEIAAKIVESQSVKNNEIEIWQTLRHPQILPLIETFQSKDCQVFICPLMEANLWNLVCEERLSFKEIQKYLGDAMKGLNHLHSKQICHLDVKPDNILINANGAKLCDFGFVAYTDTPIYISNLGMPYKFRPPEGCIYLGSDTPIKDAKACDLWGFGIMLVDLLTDFSLSAEVKTGEDWNLQVYPVLFRVLQKQEFFERVMSTFSNVDDITVKIAFDCVHRFLRKSPNKRMDTNVALKHRFFSEKNINSFNRKPKDYMWKKTKTTTSKVKCSLPRKFKAFKARI